MFEELDEQIKHGDITAMDGKETLLKWGIAAVVSIAVVVGLYLVAIPW